MVGVRVRAPAVRPTVLAASSLRWRPWIWGARLSRTGLRLVLGAHTGDVYALDAMSGCVFWSFPAAAGVRTAISVGPVKGHSPSAFAAYFGDLRGNVYALDAASGMPPWIVSVDPHPLAAVTGPPTPSPGPVHVPPASRAQPPRG